MFSRKIISVMTAMTLCVSLMIPGSVFADPTFTGGSDVSGLINTQTSIPDLQVTGGNPSDIVPVFLYVPSGSLSMTTTTGLTFTGSSSGQRLYFSGTIANVNTALSTLRYIHSGAGTFTLEASIIGAGQIYDPSTQHMYEVVNNGASITATASRSAATARSINGVNGYLANITSSDENAFVAARITQDGWFGASDAGIEGDWVWLDGPESGTLFWRGTASGTAFGYENWAGSEPNQSGDEDCSEFYANGSGWNDLPCSHAGISTYIVEYGAPGNLPNIASDTLNITLTTDITPPTITNVSSDKANGSYKAGEVIDIDVTFSEFVSSTGSVTVTLETGTTDRTCTFTVTSATTGTCNYTVQAGDTSGDLAVSSISGTIRDGALNTMTNFVPATNLAANKAIIIDTTAPVISNVYAALQYPPGVNITWMTDESATTGAFYYDTNLGTPEYDITDPALTTDHTAIVTGLTEATDYSFYLTATDLAGNTATTSTNTFATTRSIGGGGGAGVSHNYTVETKISNSTPETEAPTQSTSITTSDVQSTNTPKKPLISLVTDFSCDVHPYLKNPIKLGGNNNPADVKLLEDFLNRHEHANLVVDGVYGMKDFEAVVKWQEKYPGEILTPWGLTKGSGYIYTTSLAKIKEIEERYCS